VHAAAAPAADPSAQGAPLLVNEAGDDRDTIRPGDRVLLIVETTSASRGSSWIPPREKGFKGLVTSLGPPAPWP